MNWKITTTHKVQSSQSRAGITNSPDESKWAIKNLNEIQDIEFKNSEHGDVLRGTYESLKRDGIKTFEVEVFYSYALEFARQFNSYSDSLSLEVEHLSSRPTEDFFLLESKTFTKEGGNSFNKKQVINGLYIDKVRLTYRLKEDLTELSRLNLKDLISDVTMTL